MQIKVKICGITNFDDAQYSAEEGAAALGFIFYDKSPRYIDPEKAGRIISSLPGDVLTVGVFVNSSHRVIEETIAGTGIKAVQMSGDETPDECLGFSVPVIKAFRPKTMHELAQIAKYKISAALLDGSHNGQYGGTGVQVDPEIAKEAVNFYPVILAGGLGPDNIRETVLAVRPRAIDVNSSLEKTPGKKDFKKISLLFRKLRELQIEL